MNQKILLIEDDPLSIEFIKIFLEGEGYEVTAVTSYSQALAAFERINPTIVITDIQLEDGNGVELAKTFKLQGAQKVIGVSGNSKSQLIQMHNDISYFDQILVKPLEFSQLIAAICI